MPADDALPRSTPSAQGVSSAGLAGFLDAVEVAPDLELHSVMVLRHGHVVAEGWWAPYGPDEAHLLYSLSKSFTATAAGLAAAEGLLSFDEPVVSYFPELAGAATDERSRTMLVRHVAAMASGHVADTLDRIVTLDRTEPVRAFLGLPPEQQPGSVFCYNNGATYTLGAIVQRVTGQTLLGYLRPRLLDPLGIGPGYWHQHPAGRELGFSGLHLRTEDLARFGQLYLDDGVWHGERLLPEGWVADASAVHTANPAEPNPDWQQGYGYQLWRSRHGYRGDGAYGQFCLVLPEQDMVVVTTAQTENMQGLIDAVWDHVLPGVDAPTPDQDAALAERLAAATLPTDGGGLLGSALPEATAAMDVTAVEDDPEGGWRVTVVEDGAELVIGCGDGSWTRTEVALRDRQVVLSATGTSTGGRLVVQLVFVQTPHRLVLEVDRATLQASGRWLTVPLHRPGFNGLATGTWV
ncbi:CubicO group peptidase, beta-lactamase class C family [Friedmanniella luteola]|uniref:CubicO group peptidase, beta-lactamase class C family n=1 Tax=Friedmanniella luteola TaxID=546871 RepID=A0A1H1Q360_9ACTN|nr:serine hydrolase [Friedmanniella luteola]SDS17429.1 CubicO group peptidase, beta-lactamase class C family [Friedmanniella luteola]